jgi:nicotinate-nucleotide adenylyltransferase
MAPSGGPPPSGADRLGILGGTFNPPHIGHLICAQEARFQLGLRQVLIVPTGDPPHKPEDEDPGPAHRLALCRAAAAGDDTLAVSSLEVDREGPSFTIDTLRTLKRERPDSELYFILGGDAAASVPDWREPEGVLSLATLAVARRRGTPRDAVQQALGRLPGGDRTCYFKMPRIAVSSTMVRRRIRSGEPIRYFVPPAVSAYIRDHGLYGADGGTDTT